MRKLLLFVLFATLVLNACKKDDEKPKEPTTYVIHNKFTVVLQNVMSYYLKDSQMFDLVSHGDLSVNGMTAKKQTSHTYINVMFTLLGTQYTVVSPYNITENKANILVIDANTIVIGKKGAQTIKDLVP